MGRGEGAVTMTEEEMGVRRRRRKNVQNLVAQSKSKIRAGVEARLL